MDGDDAFFAAPPADDGTMDQGFAFVGDDGDAFGAPPEYDDFAAPPSDDAYVPPPSDYAFGVPPEEDAFAAPPAEDTPIVFGGPSQMEMPPPEEPAPVIATSAMKKFNEEWQVVLNERQSEEEAMKAEMIEAARLSMEKFSKDREAKREAKMAKNREDEQAKLEAIEADLENDNSWQKVSKMVELTHDGAKNAEDVKRMRDVLILLKNEPSRAEAVGA